MYILECSDGSLYTGWTNDLAKRMNAHNAGQGAKYTKSRRPVRLCYWEVFDTKQEAMSREAQVKRLARARKIELIEGSGEGFKVRAMRIRPVSEQDDRMAVSRVYEESWKEAYRNIIPQTYLDSIPKGAWCEAAFRSGMYSLVMTVGDEIVGTASYCRRRLFDILPDENGSSDTKMMKNMGSGKEAKDIESPEDTEDVEAWGEVVSIYFLPQYMRKGFGTLLMQAVLAELKKMEYQRCCLWVLEENERARRFYERMSFIPDGTYMEQEIGGRRLREMGYVLGLG